MPRQRASSLLERCQGNWRGGVAAGHQAVRADSEREASWQSSASPVISTRTNRSDSSSTEPAPQHLTSDVIFSRGVKPLNALTLIGTGIPDAGVAATVGQRRTVRSSHFTQPPLSVFFLHLCLKRSIFFSGRCTGVFFCGENGSGRRDYGWWTRAEETFSPILERTSRSCPGAYQPKADFSGFSLSQPEGRQSPLTRSCIVNRLLRGAFFSSAHWH